MLPNQKSRLVMLDKAAGDGIIRPVRTAHFGRCRSFPNRFRIRRKAAADLGGGYFFRSTPNLIAAITSISNAMVSAVLMRSPPLRGNNRTVLTGEPHHTRFALLCQFLPPVWVTFMLPPSSRRPPAPTRCCPRWKSSACRCGLLYRPERRRHAPRWAAPMQATLRRGR